MAMAGLYRRVLPSPPAIDFGSHEGKVSCSSLPMVAVAGDGFLRFFFFVNLAAQNEKKISVF